MGDNGPSIKDQLSDLLETAKETLKKITVGQNPLATSDEVRERLQHCNGCEHFNRETKKCEKCACFMPAKVHMAVVKCPAGKW